MKTIIFTKQPDDIRFIKDTYTNLPDARADEFIEAGVAKEYDKEKGEIIEAEPDQLETVKVDDLEEE